VQYLEDIGDNLAAFDTFELDAYGFACTGSSYLLGREREAVLVDAAASCAGFPVHTAAGAIAWAMQRQGIERIAVVAPYPQELIEAGSAYWNSWGISVSAVERVVTRSADTRTIYELASADAVDALARLRPGRAQAVILSGTGLPTLPALRAACPLPLFSSNGCLAARLLADLGREDLFDPATLRPIGWEARLAEALGASTRG
jgi:maleate isomerase